MILRAFLKQHYQRRWIGLSIAMLLGFGQIAANLPSALIVRDALGGALEQGQTQGLWWAAAAILGLQLLSSAMALGSRMFALRHTKAVLADLREELLQRCYHLPRSFFDQHDPQIIQSKIVHDSEQIDIAISMLIVFIIPSSLLALTLIPLLWWIDPWLFAALGMVGPGLVIAERHMRRQTQRHAQHYRDGLHNFSAGIGFVLQALDLTRASAAESAEIARQRRSIDHLTVVSSRLVWSDSVAIQLNQNIMMVGGLLILVIGGSGVLNGTLSLGDVLAFIVATRLLGLALRDISGAMPHIIAGKTALDSLNDLFVPTDPPYTGSATIAFRGNLSLRNVSFGYTHEAVLRDINLRLHTGQVIGIGGANGAGKSTLVALLLGFYRPWQGQIAAEEQFYPDIDMQMFRRQIGYVPQDPIFFHGSIYDNLSYGLGTVDPEHLKQALWIAAADEVVARRPDGLASRIGESGRQLSGGQRQRLALARAVLRQPRLLILDEPTNHLDSATISLFLTRVQQLQPRPTILLISHDPQVLAISDEQYHVIDGKLVAQTPSQLYATPN